MAKEITAAWIAIVVVAVLGICAVLYYGIATPIEGFINTYPVTTSQIAWGIVYIILSIIAIILLLWVIGAGVVLSIFGATI